MANNTDKNSFAVVAGHQNAGRGTRGRTWLSGSNNLFMSVALRLKSIPTPLTLIPLRYVGFAMIVHIETGPLIKRIYFNLLIPYAFPEWVLSLSPR